MMGKINLMKDEISTFNKSEKNISKLVKNSFSPHFKNKVLLFAMG